MGAIDPAARFTRLFEAAYPALWAYARRRVEPADVDDVVADTFTVAWRRLDDVPDGDAALPWLYCVARNVVANQRRSSSRRLRLVERVSAAASAGSAPGPNDAVLEALASLKPDDQEVLRLAAWEGLAPREIAVALGCGVNAATLRLSRARKKLREAMTESNARRTQAGWKEIDA